MVKSKINNNIYKGQYFIQNMDKSKQLMLPLFVVLSIVAMTMMASAATTLVAPVIDNNYTGSLTFNCSTTLLEANNATWYYNETGGRAVTVLSSLTNTTGNQSAFAKSISITSLTDATTYNITCAVVLTNATEEYADGITPITFDSTKPTCTVTKAKSFIEIINEPNTLTCSCSDAIDSAAVNTRTLTKPSGSVTITTDSYVTKSGDTDQVGKYTYACYSTDDAGNVATTASTTFNGDTSEEVDSTVGQVKSSIQNNTMMYSIIGAIVVVLLVVFLLNKD